MSYSADTVAVDLLTPDEFERIKLLTGDASRYLTLAQWTVFLCAALNREHLTDRQTLAILDAYNNQREQQ